VLFFSFRAHSEVLFEGYYKVLVDRVHAGFSIVRYEFDPKAKRFTAISFLKTGALAGNIQEGIKAVSNDKFQPVNFQYTSHSTNEIRIIDATFAKNMMTGSISNGNKKVSLKKNIPKGVFLSSFLGYLMLQHGYKVGKKFTYSAIAEETGDIANGDALIKSEEKIGDEQVYRILNKFKGAEFVSYVTGKSEILNTDSISPKIATELVGKPEDATVGQIVPSKTLITLFGKVPEGKINPISKKLAELAAAKKPTPKEAAPKPEAPKESKAPSEPTVTQPTPSEKPGP